MDLSMKLPKILSTHHTFSKVDLINSKLILLFLESIFIDLDTKLNISNIRSVGI